MKFSLLILVLGVCLVTGCGRKFTPVSTVTKTETKKDSSNVTTKTTSTDSSYVVTMIKKILHGATAGISTNTHQLDSLVSVLRAMPKGVGADTVYLTDPKRDVALRAYYDKLTGKLVLQCQSRDREYFEKETHYRKTIEALTNQLITKNTDTKTNTEKIAEPKKNLWDGLKEFFTYLGWVAIFVAVIVSIGIFDKVINWFKKK